MELINLRKPLAKVILFVLAFIVCFSHAGMHWKHIRNSNETIKQSISVVKVQIFFVEHHCELWVVVLFNRNFESLPSFLSENITSNRSQLDDESGKYLNNILNNSNSSPELIEYYDVDEVSPAPDPIYPDPESIFNQNHNGINGKSLVATKFNKLQELSSPMGEGMSAKDDSGDGGGDVGGGGGTVNRNIAVAGGGRGDNNAAISSIDFDGRSEIHETVESGTFNGKSIDFNIRHTMEELKNEDLRDHDIIDNIMYIYYGSNVALRKSLGGSIIIAGTVFALAAQILAIVFTLLRNR